MNIYLKCLIAGAALLLLCGCETTKQEKAQEKKQPKPTLSKEDIVKMTPAQIEKYYAEMDGISKQRRKDEFSFGHQRNSEKKRESLNMMDRAILDKQSNSVFPWREENRSKSLLERKSAIYSW